MDLIKGLFSGSKKDQLKSFYKVVGQASFRVEVNVVGNVPYSSCVLSVTSLANSNQHKIVIGSKCQWFRCYLSQDVPLKGSGNTYRVSALDIGARIKAVVTPTEPDESGFATVIFGPIEMEQSQKNVLKTVLNLSGGKFPFDSISPFDVEEGVHSGTLVIFSSYIKIALAGKDNEEREMKVFFGESYEIKQGSDDRSFLLKFPDNMKSQVLKDLFFLRHEDHSDKVSIKFPSQSVRDNVIIALKAFEGLIELKDRLVIDRALEMAGSEQEETGLGTAFISEEISAKLDTVSLERELYLLCKTNRDLATEKERLSIMVENMDGEASRSLYCRFHLCNSFSNAR